MRTAETIQVSRNDGGKGQGKPQTVADLRN